MFAYRVAARCDRGLSFARRTTTTPHCTGSFRMSFTGSNAGSRFVPAVVLPLAAAAAVLMGGCAGQAGSQGQDEVEEGIQRGGASSAAEHHDVSPPLTLIAPVPFRDTNVEHPVKPIPRNFNRSAQADPVHQRSISALLAPTTLVNFLGIGNGFSGPQGSFSVASAPPDTNGDVGPNHYVQTVNSSYAVFNKSGTVLFGPVALNTLWSGFGGGCQTNNDGDPVVVYDPIADRWVISQFSVSTTPFLQCVAVSTSGDPTGTFNRYSFQYANFPDYPKMGVWPDAYYITFNTFNAAGTAFLGTQACAYDRAKMLTGAAATQQCFTTSTAFGGLLPADLDGARQPPAGAPNYIVGLGSAANQLAYWKFHVDFTTPANSTFTGPTTLATAAFTEACAGGTCIPQSGTTQQLDSLADRVMFRLAYRNFGDHEALVTNHSVTAGSSTGVRWYELRPAAATRNLSIFQQGTYAPDASFRWMGSIAMDQTGNMALGFSVSSSTLKPEIHYTGRLVGDAAGTMTQGEGSIINGAGSQTGSSLSRWGDYSNMVVDPVDDCTFWYTTEYIPANGAFNWSTRIGSFKFPGCGGTVTNDFSIGASPSTVTVTAGGSGTSTISTAVTAGAAQSVTLSASGVPTGASATFSSNPISSGGSSTLTLNSGTAAAGTYSITVTGTGASATHSTTVSFVINPVVTNNFSIAASPSTVTVTAGGSGTSTISTAVTSGSAQSVTLSASGVPAGASATFSSNPITAGGSSTLTLNSGSAAAGTYSITITGTGTSTTHTATVSFVINPVVANDFSIAASPTSVNIVAGASGTSSISTATTSGSAQTVTFSSSGAPSGVTASFSPASVTSGAGSTLTIATTTGAAAGTFTLTVTGTGTSTSHSTSVSVTITSGGGTCTNSSQLLVNPGFESGNTTWVATAGVIDGSTSGSSPRTGTFKAWLDGYGSSHTDSAYQTVTIPAGACTATLTFWLKITTAETTTVTAFDKLTVSVRNTSNTVLSTLATYSNLNKGTAYVQKTFDVSSFKGQTVRIHFNGVEDSSLQTSFFVDDTALTVTQ